MDSTETHKKFNVHITEQRISFSVAISRFHEVSDVLHELFDDGPREAIQAYIQTCPILCDAVSIADRVTYKTATDFGPTPTQEEDPQWMARHLLIYRAEAHERIGEIRASWGVTNDDVIAETASHELPLQWQFRIRQDGQIFAVPRVRDIVLKKEERIEFRLTVSLYPFLNLVPPSEEGIPVGALPEQLFPYFPLDASTHLPLSKTWGWRSDAEPYQREMIRKWLALHARSSRPPAWPGSGSGEDHR